MIICIVPVGDQFNYLKLNILVINEDVLTLLLCVCVFQAEMVRSMLSPNPAERPEASDITDAPLLNEFELPCRVRQRSRTYSASSSGRPSRSSHS